MRQHPHRLDVRFELAPQGPLLMAQQVTLVTQLPHLTPVESAATLPVRLPTWGQRALPVAASLRQAVPGLFLSALPAGFPQERWSIQVASAQASEPVPGGQLALTQPDRAGPDPYRLSRALGYRRMQSLPAVRQMTLVESCSFPARQRRLLQLGSRWLPLGLAWDQQARQPVWAELARLRKLLVLGR